MTTTNFLNNCAQTFSECTRLLSSDDQDSIQTVLTRLEMMATSVRWSRGRLLQSGVVDEMLLLISELVREANDQQQQQPVDSGFTVPRMGGQTGGWPVNQIAQEQLQMLLSFNFSAKQIAEILGVSRRTVNRRLRQYKCIF